MDFISGAELIIHNAPFDLAFLNYELSLTKPASENYFTIIVRSLIPYKLQDNCMLVNEIV